MLRVDWFNTECEDFVLIAAVSVDSGMRSISLFILKA